MKIYEINMPKLFYLYRGPVKDIGRKMTSTYHCAACDHTFRSIWGICGTAYYGKRIDDREIYCPKCGSHFVEYTMHDDYGYLADGDYSPLSMTIVLDEFKDSLKLTLSGREIVSESESDYMFYERKYRETISFNTKKRMTVYKRSIAGKLTSNYTLGNPFDTSFYTETNLKALTQRAITEPYIKDFHKMLKLLREKIQSKLSKKLGYNVSSMYVCHEREKSLFTKPICNIAYRMLFTDLKNPSREEYSNMKHIDEGYTQYYLSYYEMHRSYFTAEKMAAVAKAKDTISGLLAVASLPDKPVFRRILTQAPFSFLALKKIYKIAQGDLNTFGNVYKCLIKFPTVGPRNKMMLEQFHQMSDKWGTEYINSFIRWWKKADLHKGADTINMLNRLHDKIKLWQMKISPAKLHDYLSDAIYRQDHPFRPFNLDDPVCRRLAMQFGSIKFYLPENSDVLREVGKKLHNCAGSYSDSVYEGKTNIVLMTDEVGKLKVCIEVKHNKLVQAKLFSNKPVYYEPALQVEIIKWAKKAGITYADCTDLRLNIDEVLQNIPQREAV